MTKANQKKFAILTGVILVIIALVSTMFILFNPIGADAEGGLKEGFSIEYAQVKKHTTDESAGALRFVVKVSDSVYSQFPTDSYTYGTILIPEHMLGDNELTFDTAKILEVPASKWQANETDENGEVVNHVYTAVLNFGADLDRYINTPIVARAYIKNNSTGEVSYSPVALSRSIGYVATMNIAATEFEQKALRLDLASGMSGTKTDVALTEAEKALGITFAKEYTFGGFQNAAFASLDLTKYQSVKFYMYYPTEGGGGSIKDATDGSYTVLYLSNYKDQWVEIEIKPSESGEGYELYANGTKATALKNDVALTNLNQLALNGSSGKVKYSNVTVVGIKEAEVNWETPDYNLASSMTNGTKADGTVGDTETALGITSTKQFTITAWGNTSFAERDLLAYDEVKFYIKGTAGSIRTNSDGSETGVITYLSGSYKEIHLVKNSDGTGFDVYVDNTLSTIKFYTDSSKTTEVPLTNMKQFALNGTSGTVTYSNISVISTPAPEWEEIKTDLAEGMDETKKTPVSITSAETALGITSVTEYTFGGFQNASFASLDLTQYKSVKFYMYYPTEGGGGSIKDSTDGNYTVLYLSNYKDQWVEIVIKPAASGEGYELYANGTKATALKNGAALTNLNQLALNGSSGKVKYSNIVVVPKVSVLESIAQSTTKTVTFDKVTLANGSDSLIPNVVFGGVSVPVEQISLLDILYYVNGSSVIVDEYSNVISYSGLGESTVKATLNIQGYDPFVTDNATIAVHNLIHHESVPATCTEAGTIEYWSCSGCADVHYADANALSTHDSIEASALGHEHTETIIKEPTYFEKGSKSIYCSRCHDEDLEDILEIGHKFVDGTVTLSGNNNYHIFALSELGGATEYAAGGGFEAVSTSTDWAYGVDAIRRNVQKGTINGTSTDTNYFRITLDIDFTQYTSVTFEFGMNYATVDFIIGGKTVKIPSQNAWHSFTIMGDGSVYLNGEQVDGAQMTGNSIVFEISKTNAPYAAFTIKKAVATVKETREYDLNLSDIESTPIDALNGTALTPWASAAIAEKTIGGVKQNVISQQIQSYKNSDNQSVKWNYFRYTLDIYYGQFGSVTIPIATNLHNSTTFDVYVGGVKGVITTGNAWNYITVMKDGTVYFNDDLMDGVKLSGPIVIEIDNHRPEGTYYGEFYIGTPTFTLPTDNANTWEEIDYDLASGMGGTKTDVALTEAETALGITKVTQYTFGGFQNAAFASLDLTKYQSVKFYPYRPSTGGGGSVKDSTDGGYNIFYIEPYDQWLKVEITRNATNGNYEVYVDGTLATALKNGAALTNLNQLALNGSSGVVKYSNVIGIKLPEPEWEEAPNDYNLASGMSGGKEKVEPTYAERDLGITSVTEYTFGGFQNAAFASLDLTKYEMVKFYMYYPSTGGGGSIKDATDGSYTVLYLSNDKDQWVEIVIKPAASGEGYELYANGTKATALKNDAALTNLNQLALNGSSGTIKYSNVLVCKSSTAVDDNYTIVYDSENSETSYASRELQKYYEEATGVYLFKSSYKNATSLSGNLIVLGVQPASDKGLSTEGLGESDYAIVKDGNIIYIYGTTGYGVINGVYALLEQLFDLEFYYEDTYTLAKKEGFELTADKVTEKTSNLTFDYIWSGLGELKPTEENNYSEDYAYQMGFVTDYKVAYNNVHNATTLLEEYRTSHPEWFYSEKGKTYGQIYLAAENFATGEGTLVTTVAEKIYLMLEGDTQYERKIALVFSAMDEDIWPHGTGYSNSDTLYNKYGTYAAENIIFMNAVARELDAMLGDKSIGRTIELELLCYNKTLVAPDLTGLTQADKDAVMMYKGTNVSLVPMIAPVEGNRYLSFEDSRNKVKNPATGEVDSGSKTIAQVIEGWQALANGNDMHMWWYANDGYDYFVMMDTITNMQANYQFAAEHGITVMYNQSQGANAVAPDWSRLKIYVQSELQKDVNADVDALIDNFMDVYFGAGAESMKTLLAAQKTWYANFFNAVFEENAGHYTAGGFCYSDDIAKWHFAESPKKPTLSIFDSTKNTMLVTWMGYIDAAKAAINADTSLTEAEKTELCNRVDLESLTIRYTLIEVFSTKTYDSSTSAFYQFAKSLGVTHYKEGSDGLIN